MSSKRDKIIIEGIPAPVNQEIVYKKFEYFLALGGMKRLVIVEP